MMGFKITGVVLDTRKIQKAAERGERRVLSRFGFLTRRTAQRSVKRRKKTSAVGQPPSSHTGVLRRFILYAYERATRSVIIGPKRLGNKGGGGRAPAALEHGGRSATAGKRRQAIKIRPRPTMGPAFEKTKPQLRSLWHNSIK